MRSEKETTKLCEKFDTLKKTVRTEESEIFMRRCLTLSVISGKTFGITKKGQSYWLRVINW